MKKLAILVFMACALPCAAQEATSRQLVIYNDGQHPVVTCSVSGATMTTVGHIEKCALVKDVTLEEVVQVWVDLQQKDSASFSDAITASEKREIACYKLAEKIDSALNKCSVNWTGADLEDQNGNSEHKSGAID